MEVADLWVDGCRVKEAVRSVQSCSRGRWTGAFWSSSSVYNGRKGKCVGAPFQTGQSHPGQECTAWPTQEEEASCEVRAFPPHVLPSGDPWEGLGKWHVDGQKPQPQDRRDWEQRSGRKPGISSPASQLILLGPGILGRGGSSCHCGLATEPGAGLRTLPTQPPDLVWPSEFLNHVPTAP